MQQYEKDQEGDLSFRKIINMPTKLTKQQIYSCNPMTIEQNYLIDTDIKLNNVITTINTLNINPDSPKTKKSLEICNLQYDQLIQKELVDFRIQGELIQFTEKRYLIHQLQIAQLRKQVILQRNKLKNEQRLHKRKLPHNLDQSVSSIQLSEHLKSPTEMIESWIETHFNKSQKYQAKLSKIRQQQEEQEKKEAEQQVEFVQSLNQRTEIKRQKRLLTIQQRIERAKELNSRSIEIQRKVKQTQYETLKQSQVRQQIDRQASINLDKKIDQLKQQFSEQLQQQSQIYQEKQQKAVQIKQEGDLNKQIVAKLQLLKTERNSESHNNNNKQSKVDLWSVRLPQLLHKKEEVEQQEYNNNLVYVVNKFRRVSMYKSIKSAHSQEDLTQKQQIQRERYSSKQEYYQHRGEQVQFKQKKKDEHLQSLQLKKQNDLETKFSKIKNQIVENESRHENIQKKYQEKLIQQLNKEINKHKYNQSLIKQRDKAVEDLKLIRKFDKTKSSSSLTKIPK
ncbi:unnamed protein product [Paramecium pentaurelia]|uniref:Uncharacterized protein n=1 Tax=Paramecium pentaurelia TaxID=43138 RepID=A0A8S1SFX4_9CILI|nr:unnamed protein product [Paramecium pentaurelia]